MSKAKQPHRATNLKVGSKTPSRLCPVCGTNVPERALLTCYRCWAEVPEHLKLKAYNAAKTDRTSIAIGQVAAEVISSASIPKELLREMT